MDYLDHFPTAKLDALRQLHDRKLRWVNQPKKGFLRYRKPMGTISHIKAAWCDFSGDVVRIGGADEIDDTQRQKILEVMHGFMPWRKGPFNVFGIDIDAEWRSERKWKRLLPELPTLKGKLVADIGCSNGYYMFRMAHHEPLLVLGFEPYVHHYYCFKTLNGLAELENLKIELFGAEHVHLFSDCFDIIFLMGIIYHRPSPIDTLRDIFTALKPGGTLILESQAIPGNDPIALFPKSTFAKVPGTWFVPTGACLHNWLERTGFSNVRLFFQHPMSSEEQRSTEWMIFESYQDFIDKDNPELTIEKYPAPWRVFFKASKE